MRKTGKSPIVILFIVAAVLYAIIYILPQVTGVLRSSYTAEYGELKTFDKVEGYFVRTEYVYFSEVAGAANRYIDEGKLVRKGTRIMEVAKADADDTDDADSSKESGKNSEETSEGKTEDKSENGGSGGSETNPGISHNGTSTYENIRTDVKGRHHVDTDDFVTKHEGILTYHADGNESRITPKNMEKKDKAFFRSLSNADDFELKHDTILKTDPVFKICDRAAWYIICYIPREHEKRYAAGTTVRVLINDEKTITGTVQSITDERREKRLTIRTNNWYDKFATLRQADIEVITSDVMGLLISNTSIVEKDGKKGVYVRQKTGKYVFVPINIIASDGTRSAISPSQYRDAEGNTVTTVRSYDDILRRPDRIAS